MTNKQAGFTLIEALFILLISVSLVLIPVFSINRIIESVQIDFFFRELTSNITLMQNHSVLNNEWTKIDFIPTNKEYVRFRITDHPNHPLNRELYLTSPTYGFKHAAHHDFRFYGETGNISKAGSFQFETIKGDYELIHWLGSGRFAIEKNSNE